LISKRSAPINRSKEYIKKIKQARLRINDGSNKPQDDSNTPPRDDSEEKNEDEAEILDVANDINFDEEEEDKRSEKDVKKADDVDKTSLDKESTSGSTPDKRSKKNESERIDPNEEEDDSYDLKCIHCQMRCSSLNVSLTKEIPTIGRSNIIVTIRRISDFI
jgi:hypothetical protein